MERYSKQHREPKTGPCQLNVPEPRLLRPTCQSSGTRSRCVSCSCWSMFVAFVIAVRLLAENGLHHRRVLATLIFRCWRDSFISLAVCICPSKHHAAYPLSPNSNPNPNWKKIKPKSVVWFIFTNLPVWPTKQPSTNQSVQLTSIFKCASNCDRIVLIFFWQVVSGASAIRSCQSFLNFFFAERSSQDLCSRSSSAIAPANPSCTKKHKASESFSFRWMRCLVQSSG